MARLRLASQSSNSLLHLLPNRVVSSLPRLLPRVDADLDTPADGAMTKAVGGAEVKITGRHLTITITTEKLVGVVHTKHCGGTEQEAQPLHVRHDLAVRAPERAQQYGDRKKSACVGLSTNIHFTHLVEQHPIRLA